MRRIAEQRSEIQLLLQLLQVERLVINDGDIGVLRDQARRDGGAYLPGTEYEYVHGLREDEQHVEDIAAPYVSKSQIGVAGEGRINGNRKLRRAGTKCNDGEAYHERGHAACSGHTGCTTNQDFSASDQDDKSEQEKRERHIIGTRVCAVSELRNRCGGSLYSCCNGQHLGGHVTIRTTVPRVQQPVQGLPWVPQVRK